MSGHLNFLKNIIKEMLTKIYSERGGLTSMRIILYKDYSFSNDWAITPYAFDFTYNDLM